MSGGLWSGVVRSNGVRLGMRPPFKRAIIWLSEILCNRDWWAIPIKGVNKGG